MISDNAQTFHCADTDIRSEAVRTNLANKGVNWKFIIPRPPNYGGYWERLIRTVKNILKKVIGRGYLSYDELFTCIVEIESIVNARPLCYLYDDCEGASYALTASHLINGRNISMLPSNRHFEIVSTHKLLTKRAKHQRKVPDQFTRRWKTDYLLKNLAEFTRK